MILWWRKRKVIQLWVGLCVHSGPGRNEDIPKRCFALVFSYQAIETMVPSQQRNLSPGKRFHTVLIACRLELWHWGTKEQDHTLTRTAQLYFSCLLFNPKPHARTPKLYLQREPMDCFVSHHDVTTWTKFPFSDFSLSIMPLIFLLRTRVESSLLGFWGPRPSQLCQQPNIGLPLAPNLLWATWLEHHLPIPSTPPAADPARSVNLCLIPYHHSPGYFSPGWKYTSHFQASASRFLDGLVMCLFNSLWVRL